MIVLSSEKQKFSSFDKSEVGNFLEVTRPEKFYFLDEQCWSAAGYQSTI